MNIARGSVAAGLALVATLLLTGSTAAHALPQSSDSSPGADLATPPTAVTITFGERPDPKLSTIKVLDTGGNVVSTGPTTVVASNALQLTVALKAISPGTYTVTWRTVSAVDGHLATGSFAFGVGVTPSPAASGTSSGQGTPGGSAAPPSLAAIAGRWLLFVGLIGLLGAASFGLIVATPSERLYRWLLPAAWLLAAVGTVTVVAVEIVDSGASADQVLTSSLGSGIWLRGLPILVAGGGVLLTRRQPGRTPLAIVVLGAAAALVADVLLSHAAAGANPPLDATVQVLHVLAVGLWLGGLAGLLITIGRTPSDRTARAARRFSWLATVGISVVAVTGLLRGIAEIGTIDALLTSDFGHLVIAKTALLGVLALLGAVNHFRNVPAAGQRLGGLRRVGSTELLVGATILLLTATLVNLAPPVEVAAAGAASASPSPSPSPAVVTGADFGTSVKLRLAIAPGTAGFNRFSATVTDYDSGAPVTADSVSLRFVLPARSDVGSSRLDLVPSGPGVFAATGANLSLDGTWQITAVVAHGAASVEVPLEFTTRPSGPASAAPSPTIDVNAVAGLPTIYTVHLSAGRTVQVYLDPGTAGANEVHVTFFDAAGTELPVASVAMALGPSGGTLAPLVPRQLEPGHFVADTRLAAGTYTLSVSGPAPGGDQLTTSLDIPVTK